MALRPGSDRMVACFDRHVPTMTAQAKIDFDAVTHGVKAGSRSSVVAVS